jgi:hypothetical protein
VAAYILQGTVTGAVYLNMLEVFTVSPVHQLYGDEEIYCQQDRTLPRYHHDVKAYLDGSIPNQWTG